MRVAHGRALVAHPPGLRRANRVDDSSCGSKNVLGSSLGRAMHCNDGGVGGSARDHFGGKDDGQGACGRWIADDAGEEGGIGEGGDRRRAGASGTRRGCDENAEGGKDGRTRRREGGRCADHINLGQDGRRCLTRGGEARQCLKRRPGNHAPRLPRDGELLKDIGDASSGLRTAGWGGDVELGERGSGDGINCALNPEPLQRIGCRASRTTDCRVGENAHSDLFDVSDIHCGGPAVQTPLGGSE